MGTVDTTTATGRHDVSQSVALGRNGDTQVITVPSLIALSIPRPIASVDGTASAGKTAVPVISASRLPGYLLIGSGAILLGVGTFAGVRAITESNDANAHCPTAPRCTDPQALSAESDAKTAAWVSDVSLGVGAAAVIVGTYLALRPPHKRSALRASPTAGRRAAGFVVEEGF